MIANIVDYRKNRYDVKGFVILEPSQNDNSIQEATQFTWGRETFTYDEIGWTTIAEAIEYANKYDCPCTMYVYDYDAGVNGNGARGVNSIPDDIMDSILWKQSLNTVKTVGFGGGGGGEKETFESKYNTWHRRISFIKSGVRIFSCMITLPLLFNPSLAILSLAVGLFIAEALGIVEELI